MAKCQKDKNTNNDPQYTKQINLKSEQTRTPLKTGMDSKVVRNSSFTSGNRYFIGFENLVMNYNREDEDGIRDHAKRDITVVICDTNIV